jgi:endonuclease/exonuclease/phosphatase (EEP) superfamily protein YafD
VNGQEVEVYALHADIFPWSSSANTNELATHLKAEMGKGVLVAGDLNDTPTGGAVKAFTGLGLTDVLGKFKVGATFPGNGDRIDYILADERLAPDATEAGAVESTVSDHLPVFAQFDLPQLVH